MGFLAYEIVSSLTEYGLKVKKEWSIKEKEERSKEDHRTAGLEDEKYMFGKPDSEQTPLLPIHIIEGFRRFQRNQNYPILNFAGSLLNKTRKIWFN